MATYEEIRGKTAAITGGGRGIGRAIALRLAKEGAGVCVSDLDSDAVEAVAEEIRSNGGRAIAMKIDVTQRHEVVKMIATTADHFGELNILVSNAGVGAVGRLIDTDEQTWDWLMAVNAKGTFLSCQAAAQQMIRQGKGGRIIVNASGAGKMAPGKGMPLGAYGASKHAVVGFSKQLGLELSDYGILVNCLCPGIVDTPMWDLIDRETAKIEGVPAGSVKARAVASIPLGHIQKPEDVANVVAFLASDDASYITADTVNCAGGLLPY